MAPSEALAIMSRDIGTAFCPAAMEALTGAAEAGEAEPVRGGEPEPEE